MREDKGKERGDWQIITVPSAKPSDLSMTIPYVPLSYDLDSHLCFLSKEQLF